jgi:hypothetical protein
VLTMDFRCRLRFSNRSFRVIYLFALERQLEGLKMFDHPIRYELVVRFCDDIVDKPGPPIILEVK